MGVFRSQTPRALVSTFVSRSCLAYAFYLGRIRPFYMPVSGLFFILNHSGILARTYSRSPQYGVPPDTIPLQDSSPFLYTPTHHLPTLPCTLRSEIPCPSISPWTTIHISHFRSCNLIFLLSLCGSPFQLFLVCYIQGRATLLFLPSKKNYHRKLSGTPRLSRYSFLACSRSSSVGAVLNFPYRSRITILSSFFSNSRLISVSQSASSIK